MKEYDNVTLKKIQTLELEILKDVIGVCEEFGLTYFAFAGTAIGAIRHKGFIPWDDDIDVGMPRKDYEKLLRIFNEKYSDKYIVGNPKYLKNHAGMMSEIMIKGTKFIQEACVDNGCEMGIHIDVFPFDNIPDDEKKRKKQAEEIWFWSHLLLLRHVTCPHLPTTWNDKKRKKYIFACKTVHFVLSVLRISPGWIYNRSKKACCRYNNIETERMGFCFMTNPYNDWITKSKAFPVVEADFEDIKIKLPGDIDEYLRRIYGDYMQLPPPERRRNHFPYCLDFGDKA